MRVSIIDLKKRYINERKDILKIIDRTLAKGNLVLTPEIEKFEKQICNYTGKKFCVTLNSGTDALMMALWSLGIGKGDEVITSPISFIATAGAIVHVGAKPVFVDVNKDLNINVDLIESKITRKTKVLMPVHWTGRICNMPKINSLARKYNLKVIEDSAQAMGSYYNNKHGGTFGDIGIFSSHPLKNLNAIGDAGFLITNDSKVYNKIRHYRNHGLVSRDNVEFFGINSRMDTINSNILSYRLKKLKHIISARRKNVEIYRKNLNIKEIIIPPCSKKEFNSFVMFIVLAKNRDGLKNYLSKKNIEALVYYGKPLHKQKAFKDKFIKKLKFPVSERICKEVIALPHHQYMKKSEILYVSDQIKKFYKIKK